MELANKLCLDFIATYRMVISHRPSQYGVRKNCKTSTVAIYYVHELPLFLETAEGKFEPTILKYLDADREEAISLIVSGYNEPLSSYIVLPKPSDTPSTAVFQQAADYITFLKHK
jgi:hypothetical protein